MKDPQIGWIAAISSVLMSAKRQRRSEVPTEGARRPQNFSPKVWLTRDLTRRRLVYLVPAEKVLAMHFEYSAASPMLRCVARC
jgi:hypothetical protein